MPWNGLWKLSRVYTDCGLEARIDSRDLIYNCYQCTKHALKEAYTISYVKYGIYKKQTLQANSDQCVHTFWETRRGRHVSESTVHVRRAITCINASHIYLHIYFTNFQPVSQLIKIISQIKLTYCQSNVLPGCLFRVVLDTISSTLLAK